MILGANVNPGLSAKTFVIGLSASATNIGNRTISFTYLGYAIKKEHRFKKIYPLNREFNSKAILAPSEMFEVEFQTKELIEAFAKENQNTKLYIYAYDTEGTEYKRIAGTIGDLLKNYI